MRRSAGGPRHDPDAAHRGGRRAPQPGPADDGDPTSLDGAILRVDPATGAALPGQPGSGTRDANARRIIAYGLRNPFRITVRPGTNEVWVGDVGWNTWEEINRVRTRPTRASRTSAGRATRAVAAAAASRGRYDGANLSICENLYARRRGRDRPVLRVQPRCQGRRRRRVPDGQLVDPGFAFYDERRLSRTTYDGALFFADYSRDCIWVDVRQAANGLPNPNNRASFARAGGESRRSADRTGRRPLLRRTSTAGRSTASATSP